MGIIEKGYPNNDVADKVLASLGVPLQEGYDSLDRGEVRQLIHRILDALKPSENATNDKMRKQQVANLTTQLKTKLSGAKLNPDAMSNLITILQRTSHTP